MCVVLCLDILSCFWDNFAYLSLSETYEHVSNTQNLGIFTCILNCILYKMFNIVYINGDCVECCFKY